MTDLLSIVTGLRRPQLLIRAARAGIADYSRGRDLKRLIRTPQAPSPDRAVTALLAEEERLEEHRRTGDAGYNLTRHIEVLIAMMAEARLLARAASV